MYLYLVAQLTLPSHKVAIERAIPVAKETQIEKIKSFKNQRRCQMKER